MRQKILIDTDIGSEVEDAMALTLIAASKKYEIIGVTTVTGDTNFRTRVAKKILSFFSKDKVSVIPGIGDSKEMAGWEYNVFLDKDERADIRSKTTAPNFIVNLLSRTSEDIILVGIGPLTNIAKALNKDPSIVTKVKRLVLMGGIINPPVFNGKQIPRGFEYNFCKDPLSAKKVLEADFNLELIPGDITFHQKDPWTPQEIAQLKEINHPAVKLLMDVNDIWMKELAKILKRADLPSDFVQPWINDTLLMAYLLRPDFFEVKEKIFQWKLPDKYPRLVESDKGIKTKVITKANYEAVKKFIIGILKKLSLKTSILSK